METEKLCPFNCHMKYKCKAAKNYIAGKITNTNDKAIVVAGNCPIDLLRDRAKDAIIKMGDCKDGHLYKINARNTLVGIYDKDKLGFRYNRCKFGNYFMDIEYHWDIGDVLHDMRQHGTARPVEDMGPAPIFTNDTERQKYLTEKMEDIVGN
jgi:hypothetical protein